MHVARIGFTSVKGGRHRTHGAAQLTEDGPVGDRAFCLIDPAVDSCLRTVQNPTLLQTRASWDGRVLSVQLPSGVVTGEPTATGERREVEYWGRPAVAELVEGPWAAAYSAHLGREVVLAYAPGEVIYGGSVTLVTSGSLDRLATEVGAPVDGARFRATVELDSGAAPPHVEDDWVGRRVRLGAAEVRVLSPVPRCAVTELDPASGVRDLGVLKALARYPRAHGDLAFGVDAEVTRPGWVRTGDPAGVVDG